MTEEKKNFTVNDKRIFSEDSDEKENAENVNMSSNEPYEGKEAEEDDKGADREKLHKMPEINFATFVFSLNSSALVNLGMVEDPGTGKKEKNLVLAKQTIDILGMLEEKTKGNLTEDEDKLLRNILHDLRLMYVKER